MKKQTILLYAIISLVITAVLYHHYNKPSYFIVLQTKSFENIDLALMFTNKGSDDYSEKNTQSTKQYRSQFFSRAVFQISDINQLKNLRLDFGDANNNNIFIRQILIINNKNIRESDTLVNINGGKDLELLIQKTENVQINSVTANAISFNTLSTDAFIVFNNKLFEQLSSYDKKSSNSLNNILSSIFSILTYAFFFCSLLLFIHYYTYPYWVSAKTFFEQYFLIITFSAVLLFMLINFLFGFVNDLENKEKRKVSAQPVLSKTKMRDYPQTFDRFFEMSFPLRNWLFHWNAQFKYGLFNTSPIPNDVLVGKDSYLFENESVVISDYTHTTKLDTAVADIIQPIFLQRRNWLANKGIQFYVLYAPNKNQVYPEMMPSSFIQKGPGFGINQLDFYTDLMQRSNIKVINPINELKQAKKTHPVYYKSDTHWNLYGGFIAYQALMDAISKDFPDIQRVKESDFNYTTKKSDKGDLAYMASIEKSIMRDDVYMEFKDSSRKLIMPKSSELIINMKNENPLATKKLKVLMFRDSYANYLIPFINIHFSEAHYIWSYEFLDEMIEKEKPDIVIFECLQRFIPYGSLIANAPKVYIDKKP